jgi:hypothetical protein
MTAESNEQWKCKRTNTFFVSNRTVDLKYNPSEELIGETPRTTKE